MNISLSVIKAFFVILSILVTSSLMISKSPFIMPTSLLLGAVIGLAFGLLLINLDKFYKTINIKTLSVILIGSGIGYLLGKTMILIVSSFLVTADLPSSHIAVEILKSFLMLFSIYIGCLLTLKSADELHVSIPFVKFCPTMQKKKDLVLDISALSDARIIDLASSGILDHQLILPKFLLKYLYEQSENSDESIKSKARRCLEVIKKLEEMTHLEMRTNDNDLTEIKDINEKIIKLARLLDANILVSDASKIHTPFVEGIKAINIYFLAHALKPMTKSGESIKIKVQRFGKEAKQGVGYLDDGTMVVINGGGDFIGETIDAQVLSVKHTTAGRIIFCNACYEGDENNNMQYVESFDDDISGNR